MKIIQNRRLRILVAAIILLSLLLLFMSTITFYIRSFDRQIMDEHQTHLAEISNYAIAHMTTVVRDTQATMQSAATALSSIHSEQERDAYMKALTKQYSFVYMGLAGSDGLLHATLSGESINISTEDYFKSALEGKSTVSNLMRKILENGAASGVLLSVPLEIDGQKGALISMIDIATLSNILSQESFGGEGYAYIIDKQGRIILRTKSLSFSNLFSVWESLPYDDHYSFEAFKADILADRQGLTAFTHMGVKKYAYYQTLPFNDWSLINIVAQQTVKAKTDKISRELTLLGTAAVIIFLALITLAMRSYRISQDSRLATDAKSAFLANMSHEIRTPMNAIVGLSEIMLRDELTPNHRKQLLTIRNSGKGLLTIINDILDISKIEAGKLTLTEEPYALESMLYDVTSIIAIRIGERPVEFLIEPDLNVPHRLVGDIGRIKQILINVIGNAVKFTERGSIRLIISAAPVGDQWQLRMEVKDTGIGIREEDIHKLFANFSQIDTNRNRNLEGTGLGLSISQQLCNAMNGSISATSEYEKGSSFVITLMQRCEDSTPMLYPVSNDTRVLVYEPIEILSLYESTLMDRLGVQYELCQTELEFKKLLKTCAYTHALAKVQVLEKIDPHISDTLHLISVFGQQDYARMDSGNSSLYIPMFSLQISYILNDISETARTSKIMGPGGLQIEPMPYVSILIVDDSEVNLQVAEGLMRAYEMKINQASSGRQAIAAVQHYPYDLVLLDHMMPDMDGMETLKQIRALPGESYSTLPIVALTANATSQARQTFLENGFDGFLSKPIEPRILDETLKKWLRNLNATRAAKESASSDIATNQIGSPQVEQYEIERNTCEEPPLSALQPTSGKVDFETGISRIGGMKEIYVRVLPTYVSSTTERLASLADWLEHDKERFHIEIHGLKSASASIGADQLSGLAAQMEAQCKLGQFDGLEGQLSVFLEDARQVLQEVEDYMEKTM